VLCRRRVGAIELSWTCEDERAVAARRLTGFGASEAQLSMSAKATKGALSADARMFTAPASRSFEPTRRVRAIDPEHALASARSNVSNLAVRRT
jgi:hypothetical protein